MDDRELLELAAKAAGMHRLTEWSDGILDHDSPHYGYPALHEAGPGGACGSWNPLTDDGDALRLAVKLKLIVEVGSCWLSKYGPVFGEDVLPDPLSATRRAIVRAAAEIGRAM